ncbi:MAG TPA: dioxygenase [Dehalococcoidia bacterium]
MAQSAVEERLLSDVLAAFANTPNQRLRELTSALIRHLHDFASEVKLTEEEWMTAIQFLTATGQTCTESRQEFILLSDILGVSSLVDRMNYRGLAGSTENTLLGPFYQLGSPKRANGDSLIETADAGVRLQVSGVVRSVDGRPLAGATLDVWQTASNGLYAQQDASQDPNNLRGVFTTGADGRYEFVTVRPVDYPVPVDGPVGKLLDAAGRQPVRPAHIHIIVSAPGHYTLTTHFFDSESPRLDSDPVFGVRESLVRKFEKRPDGTLATTFDVTLTPVGSPVEAKR